MTWLSGVFDADLHCESNHEWPEDGCEHCGYRESVRECGQCEATFEDGVWHPHVDSRVCGHDPLWLVDGFGRDVTPDDGSVADPWASAS